MICTCVPDAWIPCEFCCEFMRSDLDEAMRMQPQAAKPESKGSGPEGSSPLGGHSGLGAKIDHA